MLYKAWKFVGKNAFQLSVRRLQYGQKMPRRLTGTFWRKRYSTSGDRFATTLVAYVATGKLLSLLKNVRIVGIVSGQRIGYVFEEYRSAKLWRANGVPWFNQGNTNRRLSHQSLRYERGTPGFWPTSTRVSIEPWLYIAEINKGYEVMQLFARFTSRYVFTLAKTGMKRRQRKDRQCPLESPRTDRSKRGRHCLRQSPYAAHCSPRSDAPEVLFISDLMSSHTLKLCWYSGLNSHSSYWINPIDVAKKSRAVIHRMSVRHSFWKVRLDLPYRSHIGLCRPKGYHFQAVL